MFNLLYLYTFMDVFLTFIYRIIYSSVPIYISIFLIHAEFVCSAQHSFLKTTRQYFTFEMMRTRPNATRT